VGVKKNKQVFLGCSGEPRDATVAARNAVDTYGERGFEVGLAHQPALP
jgi:hypothetical protein